MSQSELFENDHQGEKIILSLFDHSGRWCQPYADAGYTVVKFDIKYGQDIFEQFPNQLLSHYPEGSRVVGIMAAPPCTDFSVSGAQYWPKKDAPGSCDREEFDSQTEYAMFMVMAVQVLVEIFEPDWWVLENPVGRLPKLLPELGRPVMYFNPCDYGDPYTKKTGLLGKFNIPIKTPVVPQKACAAGSWLMKLGGKSEKTKELRSVTPAGFAYAFFLANR